MMMNIDVPSYNLDVVMNELIKYVGETHFGVNEGDTLKVALDNFKVGTGQVHDAYIADSATFLSRVVADTLNIFAKDPNYNTEQAEKPIGVVVLAPEQSDSTFAFYASYSPLTDMTLKIVDNDDYVHGDGPAIPGRIEYNGKVIITENGYAKIKVTPRDTLKIKASLEVDGKRKGWIGTFKILAQEDAQKTVILHPVTNKNIEGLEDLFEECYQLVNNRRGSFGYEGKKGLDSNGVYWIAKRFTENGKEYIVSEADQDSVEQFLKTHIIPGQQKPMPIYKATVEDIVDPNATGGRVYILITPWGAAAGGSKDYEKDGILDMGGVYFPKVAGNFWWPWLTQEVSTVEFGPNELRDERFRPYTVLESASPDIDLQRFDIKFRRIKENMPPKEAMENIFGK